MKIKARDKPLKNKIYKGENMQKKEWKIIVSNPLIEKEKEKLTDVFFNEIKECLSRKE